MVVQLSTRFRWVFCQLETLRRCLPPSIRRTLEELPESLDETYERVLREIKKPNRDMAHRLLQCLVVAIRPLRVQELAEVFAVDFDAGEGTARLNLSWRWEDHEQALLSSCSSLISIVENVAVDSDAHSDLGINSHSGNNEIQGDGSLVVQFSHFSVKEFLTSPRLASPSRDVSRYHITLEPAHTIMAQACLGILLRLDNGVEENESGNSSPLARYAARHWVTHAQFQNVSPRIQIAIERLFDPDKPYFVAWLGSYDMDYERHSSPFYLFTSRQKSDATPLYYASLCGFQDLVEHLIAKYPHQVKTDGGYCRTPALAALEGRHFELADLLHRNGSSVDLPGHSSQTPLYSAASQGDLEMVRVLLGYKADVNSRNTSGSAPLFNALSRAPPQTLHVARLLLENGANPNVPNKYGETPLHTASGRGNLEVVRLLLKYGADVELEGEEGRTPFQAASQRGHHEVAKLLLDYGAKRTS